MEPVEINAGTWYLRALRADTRVSDVPALADLGVDDPAGCITRAADGWASETLFTWAVCIPTTGELVALVTITPSGDTAVREGWARDLIRNLQEARKSAGLEPQDRIKVRAGGKNVFYGFVGEFWTDELDDLVVTLRDRCID